MTPPSADQACTDAPQVTLGVQKLKKKINPLSRRSGASRCASWPTAWGRARRALAQGQDLAPDKPLGAARRNVSVTLTIPKKLRKPGKFTVTVTGNAPVGKARSKSTLTLEVKK